MSKKNKENSSEVGSKNEKLNYKSIIFLILLILIALVAGYYLLAENQETAEKISNGNAEVVDGPSNSERESEIDTANAGVESGTDAEIQEKRIILDENGEEVRLDENGIEMAP